MKKFIYTYIYVCIYLYNIYIHTYIPFTSNFNLNPKKPNPFFSWTEKQWSLWLFSPTAWTMVVSLRHAMRLFQLVCEFLLLMMIQHGWGSLKRCSRSVCMKVGLFYSSSVLIIMLPFCFSTLLLLLWRWFVAQKGFDLYKLDVIG